MKKSKLFILTSLIVLLFVSVIGMQSANQEVANGYDYLLQQLDNARSFTLEVLEVMPDSDYSFKPADSVRTFGEQAFHIAYSLEWFTAQLKGNPIQWAPGDESRMNKEELMAYTEVQFDNFIETIMASEESGSFTAGLMGALRHNSHHRGQMVTYIRAKGLIPPAYK